MPILSIYLSCYSVVFDLVPKAMKFTLISSDKDHRPVTGLYKNPAISSTCVCNATNEYEMNKT